MQISFVGLKLFNQLPIVQVPPFQSMKEACNIQRELYLNYETKLEKKSRKSLKLVVKECIYKLWWKIIFFSTDVHLNVLIYKRCWQ